MNKKKPKKDPDAEVSSRQALAAIDTKNRDFWNNLNDKQKKNFSPWLYMRYMSMISSSFELSGYYLMAVNAHVNRKFKLLKDHPNLQYLLLTTINPTDEPQKHLFLNPYRSARGEQKKLSLLKELFPLTNDLELEVLAQVNTDQEIKKYLIDLGWPDNEISKVFQDKDT